MLDIVDALNGEDFDLSYRAEVKEENYYQSEIWRVTIVADKDYMGFADTLEGAIKEALRRRNE